MRVSGLVLLGALLSTPTAEPPITFTRFDQNHSTIGFVVPILGDLSEVHGRFKAFTATLVYDPQDVTRGSVEVTIDASSIDTGIPDRDAHLRSPDFFDVAKCPEIRFRSTSIVRRGARLLALGTLSMHGVEKPIEIPFTIQGLDVDETSGKVSLGVRADLSLDRREYGIAWRHDRPAFVGDRIGVHIRLLSRLTPRGPSAAGQTR